MNLHYKKFVFMLCGLFLIGTAAHADDDWQLRGIALVNIKGKHVQLETHQVVSISRNGAVFAALDELGGISFTVRFSDKATTLVSPEGSTNLGGNRLKTLLSLPLTKDQLLSIIRHEITSGDTWKGKAGLAVVYSDFMTGKDGSTYPQHITITHKKNSFDLHWVKLERKF